MTRLLLRLFVRNADQTDDPKVRSAYGIWPELWEFYVIYCCLRKAGSRDPVRHPYPLQPTP